jgi:hypothetical protein
VEVGRVLEPSEHCAWPHIELESTSVTRTPSAKPPFVASYRRAFRKCACQQFPSVLRHPLTPPPPPWAWSVSADEISYTMDMATTEKPMARHLECSLTRVQDTPAQ